MKAVNPETGADIVYVGEGQEEYFSYPAGLYITEDEHIVILSRWQLTDEERKQIADGEDLFVGLMTDGQPAQPLLMQVGPEGYVVSDLTSSICPACHERFDSIKECREHVRNQHNI